MNQKRELPPYACGDRIAGKYQLLQPIGSGGMGVVWVAHNLVLDVHVALKLIRGSVAGPGAAARLLREARSAARIAHPGVVRVFDFGTTDRQDPFIVMELLGGETLRDVFDRERFLMPLRAVSLLLPVADALGALADVNIVHRDLKPDNIILVPGDDQRLQPKLVDFGVAMLPGTDRLTWAGLLVGTPDYLAPEQADGGEIDHRADVWAFSVVLFEGITGRRPFQGETVAELLTHIVETPAPSILTCGVPDEEFASIVARGLEKSPDRRWGSIRALAAALGAWARSRGLSEDATGAAVRSSLHDGPVSASISSMPPMILTPVPMAHAEAKTEVAPRARRRASEPLEVAAPERDDSSRPSPIPLSAKGDASRASKPTRLLPAWNDGEPRPPEDKAKAPVERDLPPTVDDPEAPPLRATQASWLRPSAVALLLALAVAGAVLMLRRASAPEVGAASANTASSGNSQYTATAPSASGPPQSPTAAVSASAQASSEPGSSASAAVSVEANPSSPLPAKPPPRVTSAPATPPPPRVDDRMDDLKDPYKKKK